LSQSFEDTLVLKWKFTAKNQFLSTLFGECFRERYYPSSDGQVNFVEKQGGKIVVTISEEQPLTLSYKTTSQEVSINFHYELLKGFVDKDGNTLNLLYSVVLW